MFNNVHPTAEIFIQHPLWDQNLNSAGKCHLHLMVSEGRALPHRRYRLSILRMMLIVNLGSAQNMGSMWVLRRGRRQRGLPESALGTRLAASSSAEKKAF